MKKHIGLVVWTLAALMLAESAAAVVCTSKATGNWGTVATWDCGHVPTTTDTVVLASPFTVRLNNNYTTAGLTINVGAVLNDNGNNLTVTGNVVNNGTFGTNGGALSMTGINATLSGTGTFNDTDVEIDAVGISLPAGSTMEFANQAQLRIGNNNQASFTLNGAITGMGLAAGDRIVRVYQNSSMTINGSVNAPNAYIRVEQNASITNNGSVTVQYLRTDAVTSVWTQGVGSSLTVTQTPAGTWNGVLNASANGNTVTYNSPASPLVPSGNTYYNLAGSGVTCPHTFTVTGSNPCTPVPGAGFVVSSPGSCSSVTGVGTIAWATPLNAIATDNVYATATMAAAATTNYLNCTGFNFAAVPVGATITGITVSIERKSSRNRRASDAFVYLIKGGVISTLFNGKTTTQYTTADVVEAHGGMTNLWGTTWTDTDVKAANFGVAYAAITTRSQTLSVDHVQVRVDYASAVVVTPSGFNVYDTGTTPAGSITGVIGTKIAGQAFTLDIAALDTAGTALQTAPPFTGTVKVELLDATDDTGALTGSCRSSWTLIQTLTNQTFAASDQTITGSKGRHRITPNITVNNAYKNVRVRVSYPATGAPAQVGCSTDNFAIRPNSLGTVGATDIDSQTAFTGIGTARNLTNTGATGGVVHKAGRPFTLSATAYNLDGATASSNYNGSPIAIANTTQPVAGVDGALVTGGWTANAGVITSTTAAYDEAGVIDLTLEDHDFAVVDSTDTAATCAGYYVCSAAAAAVGRFVPDHFELKDASADPALDALVNPAIDTWLPTTAHQFRTFGVTDASCSAAVPAPKRSFTYIGQSFGYVAPPQATIKAMEANGGWVQNYDFARLTATGVSQTYSATSGTPDTTLALQAATLTSNANYASGSSIVGTVSVNSADKLAFIRAIPVASFNADIKLSLDLTDNSENAVTGNGNITSGGMPVEFVSIPFDSGVQMRYGRLKLSNAFGSEQLALPVPMLAQYFDGTTWQNNVADNCSAIAVADVGLTKSPVGLPTTASLNNPIIGGNAGLRLSKPGAKGKVDIAVTTLGYLPGNAAVATFGIYKGANEFIYLREAY